MNLAFANAFGQGVLKSPKALGDAAIQGGRGAAIAAARAIDRVKAPSHRLIEVGLRASAVAHDSVARLVQNQRQVVDGIMDEGVRRLELIAGAESLRALVAEQIGLLTETHVRLSADVRRTLAILADTRVQLTALFATTPAQGSLRSAAPPTRTASVRRKAPTQRKPRKQRAPRRNSR